MKKTVLAFAALASMSGAALAQSSVTAFGIIDLAARSLKGADSVKYLSNEGRATSRLGFRGVEDLGGGLKASFHIETHVNADDGSVGGNFWQRRATVSLLGGFGELRLGRDKATTRTLLDAYDPFGTSGMPGLNRLITDGVDRNRLDNGVIYFLPSMGGVYGSVGVTAGEGANSASTQRSVSGRLGYKAGAFDVSGAYGEFGSSNKLKITALGGSYDFGGFKLAGAWIDPAGAAKGFVIGGTVRLGTVSLLAEFARDTNADDTDFLLEAKYPLSKRTFAYAAYLQDGKKKNGAFNAATVGKNVNGFGLGIRHNF